MTADDLFTVIVKWCEDVRVMSSSVDGGSERVFLHPLDIDAILRQGSTRAFLTDDNQRAAAAAIRAAGWPPVAVIDTVGPRGEGVTIHRLEVAER